METMLKVRMTGDYVFPDNFDGNFALDYTSDSPMERAMSLAFFQTYAPLMRQSLIRGFALAVFTPTIKPLTKGKIQIMASKKVAADKTRKVGDWKGFANIPFGKQDMLQCIEWVGDYTVVWAELEELLANDYKVSLTQDMRSDAFMCSISCYSEDDDNYKRTMTSRAPTLSEVVAIAIYKHVVLSNRVWVSDENDQSLYG